MFSSTLLFFEFGAGEIMFIMLVALLLFGGDKLPQLARGLGKGLRDFKDASEGIKREISNQIDNYETKKAETAVTNTTDGLTAENTENPPVDEVQNSRVPQNSVPVAEIQSTAEVEPVKEEPQHVKETPIEPAVKKTRSKTKTV
jgi:sec-independent protein translocase protein TatA